MCVYLELIILTSITELIIHFILTTTTKKTRVLCQLIFDIRRVYIVSVALFSDLGDCHGFGNRYFFCHPQ